MPCMTEEQSVRLGLELSALLFSLKISETPRQRKGKKRNLTQLRSSPGRTGEQSCVLSEWAEADDF